MRSIQGLDTKITRIKKIKDNIYYINWINNFYFVTIWPWLNLNPISKTLSLSLFQFFERSGFQNNVSIFHIMKILIQNNKYAISTISKTCGKDTSHIYTWAVLDIDAIQSFFLAMVPFDLPYNSPNWYSNS